MKKYIYTIMAVAALLLSCNKESIETPYGETDVEPITSLVIRSEETTRATISSSDATKILWDSNDGVYVYGSYSYRGQNYYTHYTYTLSKGAGSTYGEFTNGSSNITNIKQVLYPASAGNFNQFNIPTVQTARKDSFDKNAAVMYCNGNPDGKTMILAVNFLKITIKEDETDVSAVVIGSSQALTGSMSITSNGVEALSDAVNYVKLTAGNGKTLSPGDYYIAVRPCSIENPVITYKFAHSIKSKAGSSSITFADGTNVKPIKVDFSKGDVSCAVQLWENGPYWSMKNIGAQTVYDPGYYFSWGNTTGYVRNAANNGWVVAPGYSGAGEAYSGGFSIGNYWNSNGSKITRDLEAIVSEDAAVAAWGSDWRMPTYADAEGLNNNTTVQRSEDKTYYKVNGKGEYANDHIILPSIGNGYEDDIYDPGVAAVWTTRYYEDEMHNHSPYHITATYKREVPWLSNKKSASYGMNIRPVRANTDF